MMAQGTVVVINRGAINTTLVHWLRRLPGDVALLTPRGNQIPRQRNEGVHHSPGAWVLFVDSDQVPTPDALSQLLAWEQPIVGAVVMERFSPHELVAVKSIAPPARYQLGEIPKRGLLPVAALGAGFLLVRRSVFEQVAFPWFRCGQLVPDLLLEDTEFCLRASRAGVPIFLDCGLRIGHAAECVIWPGRDGRPWVEWNGPVDRREPLEQVALQAEVLIG
jgi:cellulose synthase/poly-beta-1,6-N-acetylglucosamine synthase-like glycosyltransferase